MFNANGVLTPQEMAWGTIQRIATLVGDGDITATLENRHDPGKRVFSYDELLKAVMGIAADGLGMPFPDYPVFNPYARDY